MRKRKWLKRCGVFLGSLFLLFLLLAFLIIEHKSCVVQDEKVAVAHAASARELARVLKKNMLQTEVFELAVSEAEINGLFAFMKRGVRYADGGAQISADQIETLLSLKIRGVFIDSYLNLRLVVVPSSEGLRVKHVKLGKLWIPGSLAVFAGKTLLNVGMGDQMGTMMVDSVQQVRVEGKRVVLQIKPIPDLKQRLVTAKNRFRSVRDHVSLLGDPAVVRIYYAKLIEIDQRIPNDGPISLARFMGPLFDLAMIRGGKPDEENQAALLALSIFLGHGVEGSFVGPVKTDAMKQYKRKSRKVALGNRRDLRLHFLVSVFIQIFTDSGVSNVAGEFKELMDARKGGSGFSFVDLAADRAGVKFAEIALNKNGGAAWLQNFAAGFIDEGSFFPYVKELPEGLTREEFEYVYRDVESAEYRRLVEAIDHCILQLPIYQLSGSGQVVGGPAPCMIDQALPEKLKQILALKAVKKQQKKRRKK